MQRLLRCFFMFLLVGFAPFKSFKITEHPVKIAACHLSHVAWHLLYLAAMPADRIRGITVAIRVILLSSLGCAQT